MEQSALSAEELTTLDSLIGEVSASPKPDSKTTPSLDVLVKLLAWPKALRFPGMLYFILSSRIESSHIVC
jgi:hypothetical protein